MACLGPHCRLADGEPRPSDAREWGFHVIILHFERICQQLQVLAGSGVQTYGVQYDAILLLPLAGDGTPSWFQGVNAVERAGTDGGSTGLRAQRQWNLEVADGGTGTG